jgi:hypothetical protein
VRTLGRTGLRLPVVSIGAMGDASLIRGALDAGLVYVHTSSTYEEQNAERELGRALRGLGRDAFVIASSPDLPYRFEPGQGPSADLGTGADPSLIPRSIDGSLARLGLDAVDIFYLASINDPRTVLHEPYMRAFDELKRSGKTRFVGICTHAREPEVVRAAADSGFWDVVLTAYNFRQSYREDVRAAIRYAAGAGLGVVAMKTQAGVYWDWTRLRKINMKAALKWVLQDDNVHTTIPGFSNFDEMREAMSVMDDLAMSRDEERDLRLGAALGLPGLYCQQCGQCVPQCPAGMPVPALMRAHMYAAGYGDAGKARRALRHVRATAVACGRCDRCVVRCALGLDVKASAIELASLVPA